MGERKAKNSGTRGKALKGREAKTLQDGKEEVEARIIRD
jgi:hypothetical protein